MTPETAIDTPPPRKPKDAMASAAQLARCISTETYDYWTLAYAIDFLREAAKVAPVDVEQAVRSERETCAKIAEQDEDRWTAERIAAAIRARGEAPKSEQEERS